MKNNHKEQIILYIIILFGALILGVVARLGALVAGVDNFTATVIFYGVTALGVALSLIIRMALEESLSWLLNKLFPSTFKRAEKPNKADATLQQTKMEPVSISQSTVISEMKMESTQEIEEDMIFRTKMFEKLVTLENRLIAAKYLNADLHWIAVHENGKADIKSLVTFLVALIDNNYFLPNRTPKVKTFFEARYEVTIGQNFEKKRRDLLTEKYPIIFYDYPF